LLAESDVSGMASLLLQADIPNTQTVMKIKSNALFI